LDSGLQLLEEQRLLAELADLAALAALLLALARLELEADLGPDFRLKETIQLNFLTGRHNQGLIQ
jgi:hypothetical protein